MLILPVHTCSYVIHQCYIPNLSNLFSLEDFYSIPPPPFFSSTRQQSNHELSVALKLKLFDSNLSISLIIMEISPHIVKHALLHFHIFLDTFSSA